MTFLDKTRKEGTKKVEEDQYVEFSATKRVIASSEDESRKAAKEELKNPDSPFFGLPESDIIKGSTIQQDHYEDAKNPARAPF